MTPTDPKSRSMDVIRVQGGSMRPLLRTGQKVLLARGLPPRGIIAGLVVAVRRRTHGSGILHRVVRVLPDGRFHTRGDNTARLEGPWNPSHVLGWMLAFQHPGGGEQWWREPVSLSRLMLRLHLLPRLPRQLVLRLWRPARSRSLPWQGTQPPHGSTAKASGTPRPEKPADIPDWESQAVGDDIVALNRKTGAVVVLNQTAKVVYKLANSGLTELEVVGAVTNRYPEEQRGRIGLDVAESIYTLRSIGLIQEVRRTEVYPSLPDVTKP